MTITLDLIVLIVGLLMYVLAANGKISEIGRIMFFASILALLLGADRIVASIHG